MKTLQIRIPENIIEEFKTTAKTADLTQGELFSFLVHEFRSTSSAQIQAGKLRKFKQRLKS